ncbi:RTA1 like protein-domain-containing protein [Pisolithus croceorrhizus]|nr:RTA1 like protein-domain-containing protein [Pisolithus croceorrhizus]KAI6129340.1 RTA1 like protein-domain-containing protein [Pisolithus croceorrhizus]KAI6169643.1 RTA1 like protein-domain-containing protein [Pisolithus thermaeus]
MQWLSLLLSFSALAGTVSAVQDNNGKTIVQIVYDYDPNRVAAAVAGSLYLLCSVCLFARAISNRARWALFLPIGSMNIGIGFLIRIVLPNNPDSSMLFVSQQLLILLSPAAFLAFNYFVYGQLATNCLDPSYSQIQLCEVATWFIISLNFLISMVQTFGGVLQIFKSVSTDKVGVTIVLVGLAIEAAPFALFFLLCLHVYMHIRAAGISLSSETWGPIVQALLFSSALIMLRYIYRIVEYAQGSGGYLMTHELWLYLLDTLPLFIGVIVYIPFWPPKYIVVKTDLPMSNL